MSELKSPTKQAANSGQGAGKFQLNSNYVIENTDRRCLFFISYNSIKREQLSKKPAKKHFVGLLLT